MELRTCSNARPAANIANVLANTMFPLVAIPAAAAIILPSAIPKLKCCSGATFFTSPVFVEPDKSASSTRIFLFSFASSASAFPYASRVAIFAIIYILLQVLQLLPHTVLHSVQFHASQLCFP